MFAVQPHSFVQIVGVRQRLRAIQRGLHTLFSAQAAAGAVAMNFSNASRELVETGLCDRLHFLWNFETVMPLCAHDPSCWLRSNATSRLVQARPGQGKSPR
jgi:hypothetical protein